MLSRRLPTQGRAPIPPWDGPLPVHRRVFRWLPSYGRGWSQGRREAPNGTIKSCLPLAPTGGYTAPGPGNCLQLSERPRSQPAAGPCGGKLLRSPQAPGGRFHPGMASGYPASHTLYSTDRRPWPPRSPTLSGGGSAEASRRPPKRLSRSRDSGAGGRLTSGPPRPVAVMGAVRAEGGREAGAGQRKLRCAAGAGAGRGLSTATRLSFPLSHGFLHRRSAWRQKAASARICAQQLKGNDPRAF